MAKPKRQEDVVDLSPKAREELKAAFREAEAEIDTPVGVLSSGIAQRLAFGVYDKNVRAVGRQLALITETVARIKSRKARNSAFLMARGVAFTSFSRNLTFICLGPLPDEITKMLKDVGFLRNLCGRNDSALMALSMLDAAITRGIVAPTLARIMEKAREDISLPEVTRMASVDAG